jgi:hypothetical protein
MKSVLTLWLLVLGISHGHAAAPAIVPTQSLGTARIVSKYNSMISAFKTQLVIEVINARITEVHVQLISEKLKLFEEARNNYLGP